MTGPQISAFSEATKYAFNVNELTSLLRKIGKEFTHYTQAAATYPQQVEQLVALANSEGWIAQLVYQAVQDRPNNQSIRLLLQNNPDWDPARYALQGHPCDTLYILGGRSFIGRRELRKYLKKMDTATGRKILVVKSEKRKIGKSYSKELLDFLSVHRPNSIVVPVDLDKDEFDPGKLAVRIARGLGRGEEVPKSGQQQDTRWNQEIVESLIPSSNPALTTVWWIVLDGFREKLPTEGVKDLIDQLAQRIQGTVNYRLVLLNYGYPLPLPVFVFKDTVVPLTRVEVSDYMKEIHFRKHQRDPTAGELDEYIECVYEKLDEYKTDYPEAADDQLLLNRAVADAAELILEE